MQKFDWNTFNATQDNAGGPIVRHIQESEGDQLENPGSEAPVSNYVAMGVLLVILAIFIGLKTAAP